MNLSTHCDATCHIRSDGTCNTDHKRVSLEARIVRFTLRELKRNGYRIVAVYDGQERLNVSKESDVIDAIFSVDCSTVSVHGPSGRSWFGIILGNGVDCVGGYYGERLSAIMERITGQIQERFE